MTALATRTTPKAPTKGRRGLSADYRGHKAAHARALAAPMAHIQMIGDPHCCQIRDPREEGWKQPQLLSGSAALYERRSCLYAAEIARRNGRDPGDMNARHLGAGRVLFFDGRGAEFEVEIPDRIMSFDPGAQPLCIEGPTEAQDGQVPAPRCIETADLLEASPCPALAIPDHVSTDASPDLAPPARKRRRRKTKAAPIPARVRLDAARDKARRDTFAKPERPRTMRRLRSTPD